MTQNEVRRIWEEDWNHEFIRFQTWQVRLGSLTDPEVFHGLLGRKHWDSEATFHAFVNWDKVHKKLKKEGVGYILAKSIPHTKTFEFSVPWFLAGYSNAHSLSSRPNMHPLGMVASFKPTKFDLGLMELRCVQVFDMDPKQEIEVIQ